MTAISALEIKTILFMYVPSNSKQMIYRPLPLCRLLVSRYYHLYRGDFSLPIFFLYISLHFNSVYVENG